jgi:POT family proton-dependent oligopeptide transporter
MAKDKYLTAPPASKKMPRGVPYILFNEMAERFAFYGMTAILVFYMTHHLYARDGTLAPMGDKQATSWFHFFKAAVYFLPILGALISDIWLGKYKTILLFSVVYCIGFFALTGDNTRVGLVAGLALIAVGSGVIKPCVSANVGDQFGKTNQHLLSNIYGWFYFAINLGAGISMWFCPELRAKYGPQVAFAVPAFFMVLATAAYWMGRRKFVHVPAAGWGFVKETLSGEGFRVLGRLSIIYLFVAMFWALFDQSQSSWVLQATKMDLQVWGYTLKPEQPQAFNPWLVMIMIPLFTYLIYPAASRLFNLTALRKVSIGLFVAAMAFALTAWVETRINGGDVVKYSSMTGGLWPTKVLDGQTGTAGWSSSSAPTEDSPEELVIRLRERRKWIVSSAEIDPSTILSKGEVVGILEELAIEARKSLANSRRTEEPASERLAQLEKKYRLLKSAARQAKKSRDRDAAKILAARAMNEVGIGTTILDDKLYYPKHVSLFAGDFRGKLVPKLTRELKQTKEKAEEKLERITAKKVTAKRQKLKNELADKIRGIDAKLKDAAKFLQESGWQHLGDVVLSPGGETIVVDFDPTQATHILVRVESNYGADRVKIGEIRVLTSETIPDKSRPTAENVWPNVAAIGFKPHVSWQMLMYVILTAAEILISITVLEYSYTQAPKRMKSFVQSLCLLSIAVGNVFTAVVNWFIENEDGSSKLEGASYYWFFVAAMAITAVLFIFVAGRYREKTYIQDEAQAG